MSDSENTNGGCSAVLSSVGLAGGANHEEAYELACMKLEESNLARAYLDLQAENGRLREALCWYRDEAVALAANMTAKHDMAVLASVNVLALDAGKRADGAMNLLPANVV